MIGPEIDDDSIFITKREYNIFFVSISYTLVSKTTNYIFHRLSRAYFQKSTVHISHEQRNIDKEKIKKFLSKIRLKLLDK